MWGSVSKNVAKAASLRVVAASANQVMKPNNAKTLVTFTRTRSKNIALGSSGSAMNKSNSNQQARWFSEKESQHVPVEGNTGEEYFDFTAANYDRVATILAKYPSNYKASACIPLLDLAQRQNGNFLTVSAMNKVADILECSRTRVYEVATFYTMFNREKVGKYFIQLCGTTPCMACGAGEIKDTITKHLGIKDGETTKDGLFTLLEVECLGACVNAPMIQMNDDFYEQLTPETTIELLEACKKGNPPKLTKWGSLPMNGQLSCEGPQGKTSLFEKVPAIEKVTRKEFEKAVDPKSVAKDMLYL